MKKGQAQSACLLIFNLKYWNSILYNQFFDDFLEISKIKQDQSRWSFRIITGLALIIRGYHYIYPPLISTPPLLKWTFSVSWTFWFKKSIFRFHGFVEFLAIFTRPIDFYSVSVYLWLFSAFVVTFLEFLDRFIKKSIFNFNIFIIF